MDINSYKFEPPENLKKLQEQLKIISEQSKKLIQPLTESLEKYNEIFRPIIEAAEAYSQRIKEIASKIKIPDSLTVISAMGKAQYVFWNYFTQSFIDDAINGMDINFALFDFESENDFAKSKEIIEKCKTHPFLQSHLLLFSQAVEAYHEGKYNLSAVGLTAIIDAVLTEATQNPTHKPEIRCDAILKKLEEDEYVADDEYATLTLYMTFHAMVKSFYDNIKFSEAEPDCLNRHWLMHGRSQRKNTQFDCIKLIRFLYGIILISEIEKQGIKEPNQD